MASTISAGTTSGTALNFAGDTTGNLAFQTSAGTYTQTMPNVTGNIITTGDTGTVTKSMISTSTSTGFGLCRAWANWDGTAASAITPRSSFNVSSITKTAGGTYYMNFTTAMANANYAIICSVGPSLATGNVQPWAVPIGTGGSSTTQCGIIVTQGSGYTIGDMNYVNAAIFSS